MMTVGVLLLVGRMILGPLQGLTSKLVKKARAGFLKVHQALEVAETAVDDAESAAHASGLAVAEADAAQDASVGVLATALSGDGFGRLNPFKGFGVSSPSKLCAMGTLDEANTLMALAQAVAAHPEARADSRRAAIAANRAAQAAKTAVQRHQKNVEARSKAITLRDQTLPMEWKEAFNNLKAAVRYADITEGTSHYDMVFALANKRLWRKKDASVPVVDDPVI